MQFVFVRDLIASLYSYKFSCKPLGELFVQGRLPKAAFWIKQHLPRAGGRRPPLSLLDWSLDSALEVLDFFRAVIGGSSSNQRSKMFTLGF